MLATSEHLVSELTTEVRTRSAPGGLDAQPALGDWLEEWLGLCEVRGLRQTTIEGYRRVLNLYLPAALKETRVGDLGPRDLNVLYAWLLKNGRRRGVGGLSARTVRFLHTLLRKALADACRQNLIEINPADAADPPSRRASQAPVFPTWTPGELRCFLEVSKDDRWYAAFHLAASTGLRRGELLGLRWGDLDLESAELQVVQTVVQVRWKPEVSGPKTPKSRRRVALDRHTVEVLNTHRSAARLRATDGVLDPTALVFPHPKGGPAHPDFLSAHFQRLIKKAGVRRVRLHDLRHSHATHALAAGIHPKVVSERLGHASVSMTLDLYSHVLPTMQREAAEIVASLVADSAAVECDA